HYGFGPVDWAEFMAVVKGNGPCNAQRIARRQAAHDEGGWVREAAAAHAAKRGGLPGGSGGVEPPRGPAGSSLPETAPQAARKDAA
ncbi:MAG: hypothetical protein ACREOE_12610, partial [Gemmatimonadales bacterium]